jgi:hypothetical protein
LHFYRKNVADCNKSKLALSVFDTLFNNVTQEMENSLTAKAMSFEEAFYLYNDTRDFNEKFFLNLIIKQSLENVSEVCM